MLSGRSGERTGRNPLLQASGKDTLHMYKAHRRRYLFSLGVSAHFFLGSIGGVAYLRAIGLVPRFQALALLDRDAVKSGWPRVGMRADCRLSNNFSRLTYKFSRVFEPLKAENRPVPTHIFSV